MASALKKLNLKNENEIIIIASPASFEAEIAELLAVAPFLSALVS